MTITTTATAEGGAHILLYPYPAPGHIIPILDLAHRLLDKGLTLTIVVSPTDHSLVQPFLSTYPSSFHTLVLSPNRRLSTLLARVLALHELDDAIIEWYHTHPSPPVAIVSDFFIGWTHNLACQLGIQHVLFCPSGAFAISTFQSLWRDLPKNPDPDDLNFLLSLPDVPNSPKYPWWQVSRFYRSYMEGDPEWEFFRNGTLANMACWGAVFNSFTELERVYIDHLKKVMGHDRVWAVGPLLPRHDDLVVRTTDRGGASSVPSHKVLTWLDRLETNSVLYICFGSRGTLANKQMDVLAAALESSRVHFIWCAKEDTASNRGVIPDGFEERVAGRGFLFKGWAAQVEILRHAAVGAFLTHCGWNSTLEGLSAGVVLLTWPIRADQFTNAKLVVDQLGVAKRACEGGESVPYCSELTRLLAESVGSDSEERERVKKLRDRATEAINGGSSDRDLDELVRQLNGLKED